MERTKIVEKAVGGPKAKAIIHGIVHEKDKEGGVANAIVGEPPGLDVPGRGRDGSSSNFQLPGEYRFAVKAEGFKDGQCAATIQKQADVSVDCVLESLPRTGNIVGHVKDAESSNPIANATVRVIDAQNKESGRVNVDSGGGFRVETIPRAPRRSPPRPTVTSPRSSRPT